MKLFQHIAFPAMLLLLLSCHDGGNSSGSAEDAGDTIPMKYAQHLVMVRYADRVEVTLLDPWHKGRVLSRYTHRNPLKRCVVFNTAHASLLQMLGALDAVAGVADLKYMNLPEVKRRVERGRNLSQKQGKTIVDCGNSMAPDVERMALLDADAIWLSPFENSGGYGQLEKLNIPLIECADYMETSALGRAEWMKLYGMLVGKEHEADSLFSVVEKNYLELMRKASQAPLHRKVLTERLTQGTWYVPGGRSSMGRLLQDAGGVYAWSADEHSGSLPLAFETVLDRSGDAEVWVFNYIGREPLTYNMLSAEHHGYTQMRAFQEKRVYYVNSLRVPYFEEVSFRPDWLLADYVRLLCYHACNPSDLRYLRPVQE